MADLAIKAICLYGRKDKFGVPNPFKEEEEEKGVGDVVDQVALDVEKTANSLLGLSRATFEGRIDIVIVGASGLSSSDIIIPRKADPFVRVLLDGKKMGKTTVAKHDSNPVWDEGVSLVAKGTFDNLSLHVIDKDIGKDDHMGVVNISCKELFRKKVIEGKFDLKKPTKDDLQATKTECSLSKKGSYGSLEFRVEYRPPRFEGVLHVKIDKATNLRNADGPKNKSDPFVQLSLDNQQIGKTKTIRDDHNPVWNESFDLGVTGEYANLYLAVYDHDRTSANDSLGFLKFGTREISENLKINGTLPLLPPEEDEEGSFGQMTFSITFEPPKLEGRIRVTVIQADNLANTDIGLGLKLLGGKSDPYAVISLDEKEMARTKVIKDNLNPRWNETLEFQVAGRYQLFTFDVFDEDDKKSDDHLGHINIGAEQVLVDRVVEGKYALRPNWGEKLIRHSLQKVKGTLSFKLEYLPK